MGGHDPIASGREDLRVSTSFDGDSVLIMGQNTGVSFVLTLFNICSSFVNILCAPQSQNDCLVLNVRTIMRSKNLKEKGFCHSLYLRVCTIFKKNFVLFFLSLKRVRVV